MKRSRSKQLKAALLCAGLLITGCSGTDAAQEPEQTQTETVDGPLARLFYRYFDITSEFYSGGYDLTVADRISLPAVQSDGSVRVDEKSVLNEDICYQPEGRVLRLQETISSSEEQNQDSYTCTELDTDGTLYTVVAAGNGPDAIITSMKTEKNQPEYSIEAAADRSLTEFFGLASTLQLYEESSAFSYDTDVDKPNNTQTLTITINDTAEAQRMLQEKAASRTVQSLFDCPGFEDPQLTMFQLVVTMDQYEVIRYGDLMMEVTLQHEGETFTASLSKNLTLMYPDELSLTGMVDMFYDMEQGRLQEGQTVTLISR